MPTERRNRSRCLLALAALSFTGACVKTPATEMREGMTVVAKEREPERLVRAAEAFATLGDLARAAQYYQAAVEEGADERVIVPRLVQVYVKDKQYRAAVHAGQNYLQK